MPSAIPARMDGVSSISESGRSLDVPANLDFPVSFVVSPLPQDSFTKQESPRTPLYKNPEKILDGRGSAHRVADPWAWE